MYIFFQAKLAFNWLKDIRANCLCASLLRMQIYAPRHASMHMPSNNMINDRADGHCYSFARIYDNSPEIKLHIDFCSTLSNEYLSYENFNYEIKKGGAHAR